MLLTLSLLPHERACPNFCNGVVAPSSASECYCGDAIFPQTRRGDRNEHYENWYRLGKNVIQIHGVECSGKAVLKKTPKREQLLRYFAQLPPSLICVRVDYASHRCRFAARLNPNVRHLKDRHGHDSRVL